MQGWQEQPQGGGGGGGGLHGGQGTQGWQGLETRFDEVQREN